MKLEKYKSDSNLWLDIAIMIITVIIFVLGCIGAVR